MLAFTDINESDLASCSTSCHEFKEEQNSDSVNKKITHQKRKKDEKGCFSLVKMNSFALYIYFPPLLVLCTVLKFQKGHVLRLVLVPGKKNWQLIDEVWQNIVKLPVAS